MPQSRGHLTPVERAQGGQVVEPRRGRHFRLGHDYSLVLMRGLATPGARMTYADADGTWPHDISWLTSITPPGRRCRSKGTSHGGDTTISDLPFRRPDLAQFSAHRRRGS